MAVITGNAKKYNGDPIDYVLIFDWNTPRVTRFEVPDSTGAWSYQPDYDTTCGVTYVANGCKPISHGPYLFEGKYGAMISSGYLYIGIGSSFNHYNPEYDVANVAHANWTANFYQTKDLGLFNYVRSSGIATAPYKIKVVNVFSLDWRLLIRAINNVYINDTHLFTLEFLDESDKVIAAIKTEKDGNFRSGLWYGKSLTTLTKALQVGSHPNTNGHLTFDATYIKYSAAETSNANNSFTYYVDMSSVKKIRVGGSASSTYVAGGGAAVGATLKIVPEP